MAKEMSPTLQAAYQTFRQKHPEFDLATGFSSFGPAMRNTQDPIAFSEFLNLRRMMDAEDYNFSGTGDPVHDDPAWKQALQVGSAFGGVYGLGQMTNRAPGADGSYVRDAVSNTANGMNAAVGGAAGLSGVISRLAQAGIPIGTALATRGLTGGNDGGGTSSQPSEDMQSIMDIALKRIRDQQPLQDAINTQSRMGLPTYARGGQ